MSERLKLQISSLNESKTTLEHSLNKATEFFTNPELMCNASFEGFVDFENEYTRLLTTYASTQFNQVRNDKYLLKI